MSVARVTEITASSKKSFQDAIEKGIERAAQTLKNVEGAWIQEQKIVVDERQDHRLPGQHEGDVHPYRIEKQGTAFSEPLSPAAIFLV